MEHIFAFFYNEYLPKYWFEGIKLKHIMQNILQLYTVSCKHELKKIALSNNFNKKKFAAAVCNSKRKEIDSLHRSW